MRILAFSDPHGSSKTCQAIVDASTDADVVVCAGDFGIRGEKTGDTLKLLSHIQCPLVVVSGNHDKLSVVQQVCEATPNWHCLHGNMCTLDGINFFGLGAEIPRIGADSWNESIEEEEASRLLKSAGACDVLVTHTPPYGYCDYQTDGSHEGSRSIYDAIVRDKPKLCLCGHIHNAWGASDQIASTQVHNLGPKSNWFDV